PISARPAISWAARRSARSRERVCPPERPAHRARFNWLLNSRFEVALRALPRLMWSAVALTVLASGVSANVSDPARSPRTVLTVYWSSESFPGTPELDAIIQRVLRSDSERIDYFAEYLESDRFQSEEASLALRDYIRRKYRDTKIDVVIAVTDVALQFVLRYRADLFRDAPIVFSTVAAPDASVLSTGNGLAGLVYGTGFGETLRLALKLHPATKRVFYVAGASDAAFRESMRVQLRAVVDHVGLTDINETTVTRLVAAVKAVPPGNVIL